MKAYLDTTIVTDLLLKTQAVRAKASAEVERYSESLLPDYAIKEFRYGPLQHFIWFHNKLAAHRSLEAAYKSLHALSRTPQRNKISTALEALQSAHSTVASATPMALAEKYGALSMDEVQAEELRINLKVIIYRAWRSRNSLASKNVDRLECFIQGDIEEKRGQLDIRANKCSGIDMCSVQKRMVAKLEDVETLRNAVLACPPKPENERRAKALKEISRKPKNPITEKHCRALGDAVFAFCAPSDAVILTSNIIDHEPLAKSLGKVARQYLG